MEIICRVIEQHPLQEREYTRNGIPGKFASMGFLLQSGDDQLYCEMVQESARQQGTLSKDFYYKATLNARVRDWTDSNHQTRHEQGLTLVKIAVL